MKIFLALLFSLAFLFFGYIRENKFLMVEDENFTSPNPRIEKIIGTDTVYSISNRIFVFNYQNHKAEFEQESKKMICSCIDSLKKNNECYIEFQAVPRWWGRYNDEPLPAEWTKPIFSYTWSALNPNVITVTQTEPEFTQRNISFRCK